MQDLDKALSLYRAQQEHLLLHLHRHLSKRWCQYLNKCAKAGNKQQEIHAWEMSWPARICKQTPIGKFDHSCIISDIVLAKAGMPVGIWDHIWHYRWSKIRSLIISDLRAKRIPTCKIATNGPPAAPPPPPLKKVRVASHIAEMPCLCLWPCCLMRSCLLLPKLMNLRVEAVVTDEWWSSSRSSPSSPKEGTSWEIPLHLPALARCQSIGFQNAIPEAKHSR